MLRTRLTQLTLWPCAGGVGSGSLCSFFVSRSRSLAGAASLYQCFAFFPRSSLEEGGHLRDAETLPVRKTSDTRPKFAPMRWLRVALGRSGTLRPVDAESLPRAPPGARASHDNGADPLHPITFEDYWNGRAGMVQQMILSAQHDADEDEVQ